MEGSSRLARRLWFPRRARTALLWGALCFLVGQGLLFWVLESGRPFLRDPEFERKLAALRARRAERPGRPLLLLMGSSRMAMGLRPGRLAVNHEASPAAPLVFNFGCCGTTPVTQLLTLRRLLAQGVRPDGILLEVWALHLAMTGKDQVDDLVNVQRLNYRDVRLVKRFAARPGQMWEKWRGGQVVPCFGNRFILVNRVAPGLGWRDNLAEEAWRDLDPWGWLGLRRHSTYEPFMSQDGLRLFLKGTGPFFAPFRVSPTSARALDELLALCRHEGISVMLLLMPEAEGCRRLWYTPGNEARLDDFLNGLHRAFGVPVIDARGWLGDSAFVEGVHMTHAGAAALTRRFEQELLPWLAAAAERGTGRRTLARAVR